ncbi:MAG TPA: hypothetical protein VH300_10180 [Thermoleophilaceae bacterium]|nr:hypothetical protein [Thermoleophilaceae bacterium]
MLAQLDALAGVWDMAATIGGQDLSGAWSTFEWIEDGAFLRLRADAELPADVPEELRANAPFPVTVIIGLDDSSERFGYLYADGRGVHRVYEMTLEGSEWSIWGQSGPEFFQRFFGTFSDDQNTIDARWEFSPDGETWELDFELTYRRRSSR